MFDRQVAKSHRERATGMIARQLAGFGSESLPQALAAIAYSEGGKYAGMDMNSWMEGMENGPIAKANALAALLRGNSRGLKSFPGNRDLIAAGKPALAKAALDVGFTTDFTQISGGQTVGVVSMDTKMARGTIRPGSFTLYNHLQKTRANQVVDYWPYAESTGGAPPGGAYQGFASQTSTINTNVGSYHLEYLELKLAVDGRAMTLALAQQNSFVNMGETETANGALSILTSVNWALYWGNPTLYPYQPVGYAHQIPTGNIYSFQTYVNGLTSGISNEQALFNLIYETAGTITNYRRFGQITHAFMSPTTAASMQTLVTAKLDMLVGSTVTPETRGIVVNGDLQGMNTRFGAIQFPIDMLITARDIPLQGQPNDDGTTLAVTSGPTPPAAVGVTVASATVAGSDFGTSYAGNYRYAVVSSNASMGESTVVVASAAAVIAGGSVTLSITAPAANDATVYRVFRSGLGYTGSDPSKFRWIGDVAAVQGGSTPFVDVNAHIPGSETLFLFDMDDNDSAIDYRYLLPLTKIDLFTQALFMPWAIAHIGAPRMTVPKFHAMITGYVPVNPDFNPLLPNG